MVDGDVLIAAGILAHCGFGVKRHILVVQIHEGTGVAVILSGMIVPNVACIFAVNMCFLLVFKTIENGLSNPLSMIWIITYYIFIKLSP